MKMTVFWVVVPCSLVEVHRRSRGACCLHHQGDPRKSSSLNKFIGKFMKDGRYACARDLLNKTSDVRGLLYRPVNLRYDHPFFLNLVKFDCVLYVVYESTKFNSPSNCS
jgi:hypothetical protein